MEIVAALVLGIVQGLTEFLPISSSAHLILVPWLAGWEPEGLTFDAALHFGTALAVLGYFWRDWLRFGLSFFRGLGRKSALSDKDFRFTLLLIVGTIPAMIVGAALENYVETNLRSPLITVFTLLGFGALLYYAERKGRQFRDTAGLAFMDAVWIGCAQALALIPGVSRSGITITTAMLRDTRRADATRFSFLLATPITVGAAIFEARKLLESVAVPTSAAGIKWAVLALGTASAAVTGFLCIKYFLRYVQTRSFMPFVAYRIVLALLVLWFYMRHG